MAWEGWFMVVLLLLLLIALARNWAASDLLMLGVLTFIVVVQLLTESTNLPGPDEAVAGFGNSGPITVGVLFVVVAGLMQTGAMTLITRQIIGRPRTVLTAQARFLSPVVALSAFLNNTPVVAMFMPVASDLCKKARISPSKLFLPLSYASVLGGVCTLIGTSTNLVVNGLVIKSKDRLGLEPLGMFEITKIGLPCAIIGLAYILLTSRWLLPDRKPAISLGDDPRQYTVEMIVQPGGPLVGQTLEAAGMRHLPGLFVAEIEREGQILPAVSSEERLRADDRLVFVGVIESVVDLQRIRGLTPATDQVFKLRSPRTQRCLIEAVVSDRCPLIGRSIREGRFRTVYNAAVIAVARSGKRILGKIGDIVLQPGDTLLLEAHVDFVHRQRDSGDFFLTSRVENSAPPRHERAWIALAILIGMVVVATAEWLDMMTAAMLAAGLMILTRCCTGPEARKSVDWSVLLVIAASLGVGKALEMSGAAGAIADYLVSGAQGNAWLTLAAVYLVTMIFTELITNNAAAVLVFPIAMAAAKTLGASYMPFIMAIMIGASAGFATPFGYQTNLMVYGPGGYRFNDFLRIGIPLDLLIMAVTVGLAPLIWPFYPA